MVMLQWNYQKQVWWKQEIQIFEPFVAKKFLAIWIYGWLRKSQWNIITRDRRFLQSPKHGRYTDTD